MLPKQILGLEEKKKNLYTDSYLLLVVFQFHYCFNTKLLNQLLCSVSLLVPLLPPVCFPISLFFKKTFFNVSVILCCISYENEQKEDLDLCAYFKMCIFINTLIFFFTKKFYLIETEVTLFPNFIEI